MMTSLLILFAISVTVFMASRMAVTNSKLMQNNRQYRDNLYRAETAISVAMEKHTEKWLGSGSDLFDLKDTDAGVEEISAEIKNKNGNRIKVGKYCAARIESNPLPGSFSYEFYPLHHTAPPAVGSGTSGKKQARRYGILASGTNQQNRGRVVLEAGFMKIF